MWSPTVFSLGGNRQRHSHTTQKKGYISMESEGAKIFFRNIRIMELPPGVTSPEQSAPEPE
jgi:hypothetical protein